MNAEIDGLTAQLAEALRIARENAAEVERLNAPPSGAMIEQVCLALSLEVGADGILNKSRAAETVAGWLAVRYRNISEQADTIAGLKAEVERLRPAAEAWEAYELFAEAEFETNENYPERSRAYQAAAIRAREAAKEGR